MALLGIWCPQPASHPILLVRKVLPRNAGGHWLGMERRAGPVLAWLLERCLELRELLRGQPVSGGRWCPVLANPPRAGSLTAARGRPSACDLPLKGWFLLSPGIFAVCPRSALQSELLSSGSSATKEAKLLELTSQLRKEERVPSCVPCLPLPAARAGSPQAV